MVSQISVVINTLNDEKDISKALESISWADEILVCDMHSTDKTVKVAKEFGAKVVLHEKVDFVELARNFALSKASHNWILVLDPDEEVPSSLAKRLREIANSMEQITFVRLPRKNLIFGKWIQSSMWWPDLNIRFFKKGKVKWGNKIHRPPQALGLGLDLPTDEKWAIVHHNYQTIQQFLDRMNRYTTIQAEELKKEGVEFNWQDLFEKPLSEFLSRFFANQGYKDGLHGLALSFLQAYSFMIVYLKLWEKSNFKQGELTLEELETEKNKSGQSIEYWIKYSKTNNNLLKKFLHRLKKN